MEIVIEIESRLTSQLSVISLSPKQNNMKRNKHLLFKYHNLQAYLDDG